MKSKKWISRGLALGTCALGATQVIANELTVDGKYILAALPEEQLIRVVEKKVTQVHESVYTRSVDLVRDSALGGLIRDRADLTCAALGLGSVLSYDIRETKSLDRGLIARSEGFFSRRAVLEPVFLAEAGTNSSQERWSDDYGIGPSVLIETTESYAGAIFVSLKCAGGAPGSSGTMETPAGPAAPIQEETVTVRTGDPWPGGCVLEPGTMRCRKQK